MTHSRLADARGAVFVEKLIVFLPLLATFFVTWELAELGAASLVVQRASAAAGRAAVVVLADDPRFYDGEGTGSYDGARRGDIELAAGMVLSAVPQLRANFDVDVPDGPSDQETLDVTVTADYDCGPVSFFCGGDGAIMLSSTTVHTYQGAKYTFTFEGDVGGGSAALVSAGGTAGAPAEGRYRAKNQGNGSNGQGSNNANSADCQTEKFCGMKTPAEWDAAYKECQKGKRAGGLLPPKTKNFPAKLCKMFKDPPTIVYRSDSRPPDQIAREGFQPWGNSMSLQDHVVTHGSRDSSPWVSTAQKGSGIASLSQITYVYKIKLNQPGVDVGKYMKMCGGNDGGYGAQQELAVIGGISGGEVIGYIDKKEFSRAVNSTPITTDPEKLRNSAGKAIENANWQPLP